MDAQKLLSNIEYAREMMVDPGLRKANAATLFGEGKGHIRDAITKGRPTNSLELKKFRASLQGAKYAAKRPKGGTPIFTPEDIEGMVAFVERYSGRKPRSSNRLSTSLAPGDAQERLEKWYGDKTLLESDEGVIHATLHHHDGLNSLRARGEGIQALLLCAAFIKIIQTPSYRRKFRSPLEVDNAVSRVTSWILYQYGRKEELGKLMPIIKDNLGDAALYFLVNFTWPGYLTVNVGAEFAGLKFAIDNPRGKLFAYHGNEILSASTYYNAARSASELGVDPYQKDHKRLAGFTADGMFETAINMNMERLALGDRWGAEDCATEWIARSELQFNNGYFNEAVDSMSASRKVIRGLGMTMKEVSINACEGRYYHKLWEKTRNPDDLDAAITRLKKAKADNIAMNRQWVADTILGRVDKVDFQISGRMIQDCLLGGSFGSRQPDGYGMADH